MKASPLSKLAELDDLPEGADQHRFRILQCYQLAALAALIPTGALLEKIERADSVGAILDPTLYRANHAAMMEDKKVVEAVHALAELGRAIKAGTA